MIIKITKDNINEYNLDKEKQKELNNNPFAIYLLYLKDNKEIGYIYYSDIYDRIEINNIEIKEKYRNKGYGLKLLNEVIKENKPITLEVSKNNQPAINLYKKTGFNPVAIRKGYYNGIDGILMEKK